MSTEENKKQGLTDEAATVDLFNINKHLDGLSRFIKACNTPMTISIQGSWGSGKTSIMKMVEHEIEKDVIPVFFNTWQFSQFDLGNSLAFSMIKVLLNKLHDNDENFIKRFTLLCGNALTTALKAVSIYNCNIDINKCKENTPDYNYAEQIENLHKHFQEVVDRACAREHKDRVVIFVDDLDRLVPAKAVELLEVLKLFLDCKQCVFVLAIDYEVVIRGAIEKYGFASYTSEKIDDKERNREYEKGKSFFDKIIQVPFKVPVAIYDIKNYLKDGFNKINFNIDDSDLQDYIELCATSIGSNPRSLKRLLNAFLLLTFIGEGSIDLNNKDKAKLLFAALCLQQYNEKIYNLIVSHCKCDLNDESQVDGCVSELYVLLIKLNNNSSAAKINKQYRTELSDLDLESLKRSFYSNFLDVAKIEIPETSDIELTDKSDISESSTHDCCNLNEVNELENDDFVPEISEDNKKALKQFIETFALSSTTASDSQGKDDGNQYASKYSAKQMMFISLWNDFIKIARNSTDSSCLYTNLKPSPTGCILFTSGINKIGTISLTLYPQRNFIKVTFIRKSGWSEWNNMLQDKDAIIKKLGEKSKFESNGKGSTELSQINRFLGVNFENNADKERVFAEVAKYIVELRNVVVRYLK